MSYPHLLAAMPEKIRGLPLPLRQKYLNEMYPNLTQTDIDTKIKSLQQRQVFVLFYGFGCEPMSNADIRNELGINSHNQVSVQLERAERRLGLDKNKRYELLKALRKEYYKKHRPRCPFCKASKAQSRGSTENEDVWSCGRCKRQYRTERKTNDSAKRSQRVNITFKLSEEGDISHLVVKVDGAYKVMNGTLQAVVGDEDWSLKLGRADETGAFTQK
jgi:ribosomal protein L37AE/L43A